MHIFRLQLGICASPPGYAQGVDDGFRKLARQTAVRAAIAAVAVGLFAWVVGIGTLVGFAVWIAAHTARSTKKKGEASA